MVIGPHRGPFRGPQNRARLLGVKPSFVTDISAFDLGWFAPLSEPAAYQIEPGLSAAWTAYTSGASLPIIKPDMWHMQLAEPQRRRDMPTAEQPPWFTTADTRTPEDPTKTFWFNWFSEPQRRRDMPAADQPWNFTIDYSHPTPQADSWHQSLAEPQRNKQSVPWQQFFTADTRVPANLAEAYWFNALSEPQRRKDIPASNQPWTFTADTRTPANPATTFWFNPLTEPQRRKDIPQSNQPWDFTIDWRWTSPAPTDLRSFWFNPLSEPVRNKIPVAWQQFFTIDTNWQAPPGSAFTDWYNWLSEPQRRRDIPQSNQPWDFTMDWKWSAPTPVTVPAFFYNWLSEPIQIEPGLSAAWTQYTGGASLPTIFADSWHWALAEPVRSKPDIPYRDPFTMDAKWSAPTPPAVPAIGWLASLVDPIQIETGLGAQHMQVTAVGPGAAADLQLFWLEWLSDPVRRADTPQLRPWDFSWNPNTPPSVTDLQNFWFNPFSEPVRRRDMPAADQPWNFTIDWSHPTPQADSWHMQLAEPRWQRIFPAAPNPFFVTDYSHPTPQADSWHQALAEPQRRRDMIAADQPWPFTMDWQWQAPPNASHWHMQLAEPQRRRDIPVSNQPWPFTIDTRTPATPSQIPAWYNFLSEPVRQKPGLIPAAQQFFTMDWKWSAPAPVSFKYSFALIEMFDRGVFNFFEGAVAAGAKVGIEEIRIGTSANVGISEIIAP